MDREVRRRSRWACQEGRGGRGGVEHAGDSRDCNALHFAALILLE